MVAQRQALKRDCVAAEVLILKAFDAATQPGHIACRPVGKCWRHTCSQCGADCAVAIVNGKVRPAIALGEGRHEAVQRNAVV